MFTCYDKLLVYIYLFSFSIFCEHFYKDYGYQKCLISDQLFTCFHWLVMSSKSSDWKASLLSC